MKKLKENPDFIPCTPVKGDEMLGGFPFNWNITRATEWICQNADQVELSVVQVGPPGLGADSANLDETFEKHDPVTNTILNIHEYCMRNPLKPVMERIPFAILW